jgi:primase-polymerase (primpol)-like protein
VLAVRVDGIPDALRAVDRWLLWRYEPRGDDRWSKLPYHPDGGAAKSNDPATWSSFADAITAYRSGRFDGVGFVLGDGWAGLDFDHCEARPAFDGVYVERSPSATGYKVFGRAARIGGEVNYRTTPASRTPWSSARYFAVTGHGDGDPLTDLTALLDTWVPTTARSLADRRIPAFLPRSTRGTERLLSLSDDAVVERILASAQADKFVALVRGDLSAYGGDHSRADQALVSILVYWTQGDLDQVDRLFRESALMRDKWNIASYRLATLTKAVSR